MFTLSFERAHKVLKACVSGVLSSGDIVGLDQAALVFTARHGLTRGIIDFSRIEAIAVPASKLAERGIQPQMIPGRQRVMVIPRSDWAELARGFSELQRLAGAVPPVVVFSLPEAYSFSAWSTRSSNPLARNQRRSDEDVILDDQNN
jgi:hypothetical protein